MAVPIHTIATQGFHDAKSYDKHRPSYPPSALDSLLAHAGVKGLPGARVVDLGAGSGIFTQLLAERSEGYEVVAVEPLEGMRGVLEERGLRNVVVREGSAGAVPVGEGWGDLCVAAQV